MTTWSSLNPPATRREREAATAIAETLAREYAGKGADAVVLAGSWARGDAHRWSDVDLWVMGRRSGTEAVWREPFLINVLRSTPARERRLLSSPRRAGACVPGWRAARVLHDPHGVAAGLQLEARRFRWNSISERCDRWVGKSIEGWAEEVVKLVRSLAEGNLETAAVQRNLLADSLGFAIAVHRRWFWDSENEFWERISRLMGGEWSRAQRRALGVGSPTFEESCRAAITLYAATGKAVWEVLTEQQRHIAVHACRVAGVTLSAGPK